MINYSPKLDRAFQALSDPVRRGMLARLSRGPASVSELAKPLTISLPAVLQHLRALEASGLVRSDKKGRVRTVRLETKALSAAEAWIANRRAEWEAQLDRFETYLSTLKKNGDQ
jgi:DNA-binding transcriptional ArsR family regulator